MKKKIVAGCIALAAIVGAGQASAATYAVTADTSVYQGFGPAANGNLAGFGFQDLLVGRTNSGHSQVALLDFSSLDAALATLPGGFTATLNIYVNCAAGGFVQSCNGTTAIDINTKIGAWTETGSITWPSTEGGTKYGSFNATGANGWISTDITALVQAWAAANSTGDGIVLSSMAYPEVKNGAQFVSAMFAGDNSNTIAFIDIQAAAVPVPGALPLFAGGLGVIGLLVRRRRQKA